MQFTMIIGDIEIGSAAPYYWLTPYEGLGEPPVRVSVLNNAGAHGGYLAGRALFGARQIPVNMKIMTSCTEEFVKARRRLYSVLPLGELVDVVIRNEMGELYYLQAMRTNDMDMQINGMVEADATIELVAPDAVVYGFTNKQMNEARVERDISGGLRWDANGLRWTASGLLWAAGSSPVVIKNDGDTATHPIVIIRGRASNPHIRRRGNTGGVKVEVRMAEGDMLYIDMRNQVVLLNPDIDETTKRAVPGTGASLRNSVAEANWWALLPGDTPVELVTANSSDTGVATLYWLDGYRSVL